MAEVGPEITVQLVLKGSTVMMEKLVPAPVRMLTASVVRTVLPDGNPLLAVVAVRVAVREAVAVALAGPVVRVGVAEAVEVTAR